MFEDKIECIMAGIVDERESVIKDEIRKIDGLQIFFPLTFNFQRGQLGKPVA